MSGSDRWFLRKSSDRPFGPVTWETLRAWAADGRVEPGDEVSADDGAWRPARDIPDLGMDWLVELPDGSLFGPVPLHAFLGMLRDGSLTAGLRVRRKDQAAFRTIVDLAAEIAAVDQPVPAEPGVGIPLDTPRSDGVVERARPASAAPASPPTASRINPPDEARMLGELRSALGVGGLFTGLKRRRPEKTE